MRVLAGLAGRDLSASRSPWLHEREADAQGLRMVYSLFDFAERDWNESDLPRLIDAGRRLGMAGFNVTHPYKQAVVRHLDALSEGAARIGSVNTIRFDGDRAIGHNTDVTGFAESFGHGLPDAAKRHVTQMGAGGAGVATAHALLDLGVGRIAVFDPDAERRQALVDRLAEAFGPQRVADDDLATALARADGVVNATPVGMAGHPGSAVPLHALRPEMWVAEIVYFPLETQLLHAARLRGCATLDGSGMAVHQAAAAWDIFTGRIADRARMARSFAELDVPTAGMDGRGAVWQAADGARDLSS